MALSAISISKAFARAIVTLTRSVVPNKFKVLYGIFDEVDEIDCEKPYFKPLSVCDLSVFNENDIKVLEYVAEKISRINYYVLH